MGSDLPSGLGTSFKVRPLNRWYNNYDWRNGEVVTLESAKLPCEGPIPSCASIIFEI